MTDLLSDPENAPAVIAGVAALFGVALGLVANWIQAHVARRGTRNDALRTVRRDVYAGTVAAHTAWHASLVGIVNAAGRANMFAAATTWFTVTDEQVEENNEGWAALVASYGALRLVASPNVVDLADRALAKSTAARWLANNSPLIRAKIMAQPVEKVGEYTAWAKPGSTV